MKMKCWAVAQVLAFAGIAAAADGVTTRGIIRAGIDSKGRVHGEFAKQTGLKNATSLNYKILILDADGKEKPVNEATQTFKFGQQFRLQIEADSDLYLYVFHEGPDNVRTVLLPDAIDKGQVPQVKRGQSIMLPNDGTYFEFAPPPGQEKLLVFATSDLRPELTPKEAFDSQDKQNKKKLIDLKSKQDEVFLNSKVNAPLKPQTANDLKKMVQANEQVPEFRLRGVRWEPETENPQEGKTVLVGSYDEKKKPEVFVEIALKTAK